MGSLFTKIFLSFWLAALLLGGAFFTFERQLGASAVNQAAERVDAHAETAAALLADEGMVAVQRWLAGMARSERMPLLLLDADYRPLRYQRMPHRVREHLDRTLAPGIRPLGPGLYSIVRPVPESDPPVYLAAVTRLPHAPNLPLAARLALAIAVTGAISMGLAALITRPIRRVRRAAQALAEGDLSVRVGYRGRDEVAALAHDFDLMADRVRDLLQAQRLLLRDISHELRSPLARLRVALELARKKGDAETALARIEREADRLESMVAEVLTLARLEASQTHLERSPVAFADLLPSIVQDAAFEAEASGKEVWLDLQVSDLQMRGDPALLRAAVENVVRNAVRHTPAGTAVAVVLRREMNEAIIEVRDSGPGVAAAELSRLFQPFARAGDARDRISGGYGLGLAISRQAVEAHGGSIAAANLPHGGLEVTLRLPLAG